MAINESFATFDAAGQPLAPVDSGWNRIRNTVDNTTSTDATERSSDPFYHGSDTGLIGSAPVGEHQVFMQIRNADGSPLSELGSKWIEVDDAMFSELQTLNIGSQSSGAGAGKVTFNPLNFSIEPGTLGPVLDTKLAAGINLQVELAVYKKTATDAVLTDDYLLGTAGLSAHGVSDGNHSYSLGYGQILETHIPIDEDGQPTGRPVQQGWDRVRNVALDQAGSRIGNIAAPSSLDDMQHATPGHAPTSYYVRFTDSRHGVLTGENDQGSWFEVTDVFYSSKQTLNIGSQTGGVGAGKVSFGPLSFNLAGGALTDKLDSALAKGQTYDSIELVGYGENGHGPVKLTETVFRVSAASHDQIDVLTGQHSMQFEYGSLTESVATFDSKGQPGTPVTSGWNAVRNGPESSTSNFDAVDRSSDPFHNGQATGTIGEGGEAGNRAVLQIGNADGTPISGIGSNWIVLDSASLGQLQTLNIGSQSSGAGAGKVTFEPLSLGLKPGSIAPLLDQALAQSKQLQVEIAVYGQDGHGGEVRLDDYLFGSAQLASHDAQLFGDSTAQSYTLDYRQYLQTHSQFDGPGTPLNPVVSGWDRERNVQILQDGGRVGTVHAGMDGNSLSFHRTAPEANDYFVRFTDSNGHVMSGDVAGAEWFSISGYGYGSSQSSAASRVTFDPLTFSLGASKLTQQLDDMLARGKTLCSIEVVGYAHDGEGALKTSDTVFKLVGVSGDQIDVGSGSHALSFEYGSVVESRLNLDQTGHPAQPVTAGWDRVTNKADTSTDFDAHERPGDPFVNGQPDGTVENDRIDSDDRIYMHLRNANGSNFAGLGDQWIRVDQALFGELQTLNIGSSSSGAGAGKVTFDPLLLSFSPGALGPLLDHNLAAGIPLQVELAVYGDTGFGSSRLDDYRFGTAGLTHHSTAGSSQVYELQYGQYLMSHYQLDADGNQIGQPRTDGWDRVKNISISNPTNPNISPIEAPLHETDIAIYANGYLPPSAPDQPAAPHLAVDTGLAGDHITSNPTLSYPVADAGAALLYSTDGTHFSSSAPSFATDGSADGQHTVYLEQEANGVTSQASSFTFTLDTVGANVVSASADHTGAVLHAGAVISFTLAVSEPVDASGSALDLSNGATAVFDPTHSTATLLVYTYAVTKADAASGDLKVSGIAGNILDLAGNPLNPASFTGLDTGDVIEPNNPATISGTTSGAVVLSQTETASGTLNVDDADSGEAGIQGESDIKGQFGTFSIDTLGHWSYALDNPDAVLEARLHGQPTTDSFDVSSTDGSAHQSVTISVSVPDAAGAITLTGTEGGKAHDGAALGFSLSDDDGIASPVIYIFVAGDGSVLQSGEATTFTPRFGQRGSTITVTASYTDGFGNADMASTSFVVATESVAHFAPAAPPTGAPGSVAPAAFLPDGSSYVARYGSDGALTSIRLTAPDGSLDNFVFTGGVLVSETQIHPDSSRDIFLSDIPGRSYVSEHDIYDATGILVSQRRSHADGSLDRSYVFDTLLGVKMTDIYDAAGNLLIHLEARNDGSSDRLVYTDGVLTSETQVHTDGSRDLFLSHVTGRSYVSEHDVYDASGTLLSQLRNHEDGSADRSYVFDKLHGVKTTDIYDDAGTLVTHIDVRSDGTSDRLVYTDGVLTSETHVHADGSRDLLLSHITGRSYVSEHDVNDPSGTLISQIRNRADGTTDRSYVFDPASGDRTTNTYDAAGSLLSHSEVHGDGSSETQTFAGGLLVRKQQIHADQSKDVFLSNVTGKAYVALHQHFDSNGKLTYADQINADAGNTHSQTAYAAGVTLMSTPGIADSFRSFGGDTFVFAAGSGKDSITGFHAGQGAGHDVLVFDASEVADLADLSITISGSADTLIKLGPDDEVLLKGITPGALDAHDFLFLPHSQLLV